MTEKNHGLHSRIDRPELSEPFLAAVSEELRKLRGPDRVALYDVAETVRHQQSYDDSGLEAARLVLREADKPETPHATRVACRRLAPRLVTGRVRR